MLLSEDPFNGRMNAFTRNNNRQSVALDMLDRKNCRKLDDSDNEDASSYQGSMVSGNFGGMKSIKTPGFNENKKFNFAGSDTI